MCCGSKRKSVDTTGKRTLASPLGPQRPAPSPVPRPPARGDERRDAQVTFVK